MSSSTHTSAELASDWRSAARPVLARLASIAVCGLLPAVVLVIFFDTAIRSDLIAVDLRPHYEAALAVIDGESPYPNLDEARNGELRGYVYPPLLPLLTVPFTALPMDTAGLLVMVLLALTAAAIPFTLGIRDWRCYGVIFLWPPVLSAIQTGNVTLVFGLCAALVWRFRDRAQLSAVSLGFTLAAKFFLWPLVIWLAATRRLRAAGLTCLAGAALLLLSWAVIGFAGLVDYPELMQKLDSTGSETTRTP